MTRTRRGLTDSQLRAAPVHARLNRAYLQRNPQLLLNAPHVGTIGGSAVVASNLRSRLYNGTRRRSVNRYILFRAFLKSLVELQNLQQKDASPIIAVLWARDIFKSKWAILARAFTLIRDAGVSGTVEAFLRIACPYIGIIPIDQYLSSMNWVFEIREQTETGQSTAVLRQTFAPDINSFPSHIARTNLTDLDIINFCATRGLLPTATATGITQGWSQLAHPMAQMAAQGSVTTTQQLASTQNAYGHFQLPILRRNFDPPINDALDVPLPADHPAPTPAPASGITPTTGAPLNVVTPVPLDGWTHSMMAGWWTQDTEALTMDSLYDLDEFDKFNPAADLARSHSIDPIADGIAESS
uniref:Mating-type protein MAT1-1-1 n=1 Tax=Clarireedia homoeocarpa TaxID=1436886 RepID=A0A0G2SKJ1_9HELO|nr:mating-type protein MAT1-1-1 [Clarireedia homoeocarpa]